MATVTNGAQTFTTTPATSVAATPALNDLIVCYVFSAAVAGGATAVSDNNSGGAGTYVQVDVDRTAGTNIVQCAWVRTALIGSATSTTFSYTAAGSTGGGIWVVRISGMTKTGATAVRSSGGQSLGTTGTTPAPVLSLTPLTTNPIIIGLHNNTNGTANQTVRAGYTEAFDLGHSAPVAGAAGQFLSSGETSATLTFGGTTPSAFSTLALELDASAASATSYPFPRDRTSQRTYPLRDSDPWSTRGGWA